MGTYLCTFVLLAINSVACRTIYLELNTPRSEELTFMKKYGYLPDDQGDLDYAYTSHSISEAVRKMQQFAGLPQTGILDPETRSLFKKKRCGVKDIESDSARSRRYIVQQGWNKTAITYRVLNGASTLEKSRVELLMAEGLAVWAPHGGLSFSALDDGHADIQVSFANGDHGDGFPFDGPGHVVAHAFPPPHGAMHFDDDELWGENPDEDDEDVTDFFAVAVHEIGHALGMSHSNVKASVMYPYYQVPVEKLHVDDILGMQELYLKDELPADASAEGTENPVLSHSSFVPRFTKAASTETDEEDIPDLCYTNYDTIQVIKGNIYVFEEENETDIIIACTVKSTSSITLAIDFHAYGTRTKWVWVLRDRKQIEPGYPKRFHEVFIGLPEHVNIVKTIYEKQNGNVVIFKGRRYWEFDPTFNLIKKGNIKEYSIPNRVPELTTVFVSNYNNKTYLIEYERFWRFDEDTRTLDRGYPKEMSAWRDVPAPVDSALIWNGDTYFFRGPRFWRFDNALVRAHEYYPAPTAQVWFPCVRSTDMDRYITNMP